MQIFVEIYPNSTSFLLPPGSRCDSSPPPCAPPPMLAADKRFLQQNLKLRLTEIEDKELALYTQNLQTIGTQAALLMGFAFAAIYEVKDTMEHMPDAFQVISPWSDQG